MMSAMASIALIGRRRRFVMGDWERGVVSAHSFANDERVGTDWHQLALADCVAASIAHFVSFEVGNLIETFSRFGFIATGWPWPAIAVLRMETVIYMAMEALWAMKPRADPNEDAPVNHSGP